MKQKKVQMMMTRMMIAQMTGMMIREKEEKVQMTPMMIMVEEKKGKEKEMMMINYINL